MTRIEEAMRKRSQAGRSTAAPVTEAPAGAGPFAGVRSGPGSVDERIVSFHHPRSDLTENFKQIRIVVQNMLPEGENKLILFTSSYGPEGKTTASLNYATAVAQDASKRVLIVDADLRKPKVHEYLGMRPGRGFGDLLMSDAPVESVVVRTPIPGLSAILCGEIPPNPSELLGTERVGQIFAELKDKYDCVVVDTAPVLPVVDTIHVAPYADGVILVVEASRTSRKKVRRAIQLLNNANAAVMGFLLNKGMVALADSA